MAHKLEVDAIETRDQCDLFKLHDLFNLCDISNTLELSGNNFSCIPMQFNLVISTISLLIYAYL